MLRRLASAGALLVLLSAVALPISAYVSRARDVTVYLHGSGVAVRADGRTTLLPATAAPGDLLPGSRVLADPTHPVAAATLAAAQRAWLADGTLPGSGTRWADMSRKALLDLHVLTPPSGGTAAGWAHAWRYVWPRDAAFVAAAFARSGHRADAQRELAYLQRVQGANGLFEARYLLDGTGPPDERWAQSDGSGWALWAAAELADSLRTHREKVAAVRPLRDLIERSLAQTLEQTRSGASLPVPGPDYRETPEDAVTLGIAGPLLAGLQAAGRLERLLGNGSLAGQADLAAERFAATVIAAFGPTYQRTAGSTGRRLGHHLPAAAVHGRRAARLGVGGRHHGAPAAPAGRRAGARDRLARPAGVLDPGDGAVRRVGGRRRRPGGRRALAGLARRTPDGGRIPPGEGGRRRPAGRRHAPRLDRCPGPAHPCHAGRLS